MYLKVIIIAILGSLVFIDMTSKKRNSNYRFIAIVAIILLILQSGLRGLSIGPDTYNYYQHFVEGLSTSWSDVINSVNSYGQEGVKDPGYFAFQKLFQVVSKNYHVYLVFVAVCFFIPFVLFIKSYVKTSFGFFLSVVTYLSLFYGFFSTTGIRQTLATAICLISIRYIREKKLFIYILLIVAASFLHRSALLYLPFYFIAQISRPRLVFVFALVTFPIMTIISNRFAYEMAVLSGNETYLMYAEDSSTGAISFSIFYVSVLVAGFIKFWNDKPFLKQYSMVFNAMSLGLFFLPLTFTSAALMRVVQYFSIFMVVFITFLPQGKEKRIWRLVTIVAVLAMFYRILSTNDPYLFFWQDAII